MNYPPMRRKDKALTEAEAMEILAAGEYGVLSTSGEGGLPSGVPLNYAMDGGDVTFHCALAGQKVDNMRRQPHVCFTVVGKTRPAYAGDFTTYFESAIAYGTAEFVEDDAEKIRLLRLLCEKYLPGHMDKFEGALKSLPATGVWRIRVDHLTGKAKR